MRCLRLEEIASGLDGGRIGFWIRSERRSRLLSGLNAGCFDSRLASDAKLLGCCLGCIPRLPDFASDHAQAIGYRAPYCRLEASFIVRRYGHSLAGRGVVGAFPAELGEQFLFLGAIGPGDGLVGRRAGSGAE